MLAMVLMIFFNCCSTSRDISAKFQNISTSRKKIIKNILYIVYIEIESHGINVLNIFIFTSKNIMQRFYKDVFRAFVDFEKSYDTINRQGM